MKKSILTLGLAALALFLWSGLSASEKIRVLLVDGPQKYHKYEETTPILKRILEQTERFEVDLSRSSQESCADGSYRPDFEAYDVVVINEGFGATPWPAATRKAFEDYMSAGGGMVAYHAANNSWPEWTEYNRMMRGLPATFMHGPDELYDRLRGPAENVTILASAYSSKEKKGTDRHEPILMVVRYGEGRIFHTVLGHYVPHLLEGSFITTFQRGTEWAATGAVTIPVPKDFPDQTLEP